MAISPPIRGCFHASFLWDIVEVFCLLSYCFIRIAGKCCLMGRDLDSDVYEAAVLYNTFYFSFSLPSKMVLRILIFLLKNWGGDAD